MNTHLITIKFMISLIISMRLHSITIIINSPISHTTKSQRKLRMSVSINSLEHMFVQKSVPRKSLKPKWKKL